MPLPRSRHALLFLVSLAGCSGRDTVPNSHNVADSQVAPPSTAVAVSRAPHDFGGNIDAVCDTVAARWNGLGGAVVTRTDSGPPATRACIVVMNAVNGVDKTKPWPSYWKDRPPPGSGWTMIIGTEADGPGARYQTLGQGTVRCEIVTESDGGDDSDSTYVRKPWVREYTRCWSKAEGFTLEDTSYDAWSKANDKRQLERAKASTTPR